MPTTPNGVTWSQPALWDEPMDYPNKPGYVRGSDTSKAAAQSVNLVRRSAAQTYVRRVLAERERTDIPGLTCDELEVMTGWLHQTASALLRKMVLDGEVYDSSLRRRTRTGRMATVRRPVLS